MTKRLKKFVAIATLMASFMMISSPVDALTADELAEQIATLQAQLLVLTAQLGELEGDEEEAAVVVEGCDISSFDRNLKQGMSGDDVKCLQIVLNSDPDTVLGDEGAGSPGNETSYFGPITKAGVIKFQEKYADEVLASWGLTAGTGFVGSTSRTKLDELLTGGAGEAAEEEEEEAAEEGEQVVIPTSGIAVSLSANTPVATTIAGGSTNVAFAKINFTAAEDSVISSINKENWLGLQRRYYCCKAMGRICSGWRNSSFEFHHLQSHFWWFELVSSSRHYQNPDCYCRHADNHRWRNCW